MTLKAALLPHPRTPCAALASLEAHVAVAGGVLRLSYRAEGEIARLALPSPAAPARRDGLWERTCFEAFLKRPGGEPYVELNLSPSGEWAAYRFDRYRAGMAPLDLPGAPHIRVHAEATPLILEAEVELGPTILPAGARLALSAVIEEASGRKSYWALAHPPDRPDFHAPVGFAFSLPLPEIA